MAGEAEIKELQKKLAASPDSMVFAPLADAYRKAGRLDEAIETCRKGLDQHPAYATARAILGRALAEKGMADEAIAEFQKITVSDPANIMAHGMLGQLFSTKNRYAEAIEEYQKVLAMNPDDSAAQAQLQNALEKAREVPAAAPPPPAEGAPAQAAAQAPAQDEEKEEKLATITVAEIYIKKGAIDEAVEVFKEILQSDPENKTAKQKLAELLSIKQKKANEEEAKRKAEEERQRKEAEEAKRKAEEEERQRKEAEEAQRKAEEENQPEKITADDIFSVMKMTSPDEVIDEDAGKRTSPPKPAQATGEGIDPKVVQLVQEFNKANGIQASLLLDRSGKVLDAQLSGGQDPKVLGQVSATIFASTEKAVGRMRFGSLHQVIIAGEDGRQILFIQLKGGVLTAMTQKNVNLGLLRIALNDLVKKAGA
jgi:predicted regulator of Ras-like GTPase activity (Roadblock/LC7/MglB family)/cytochrome c-type biogenesis protein CcmH/NrfG